MDNVQLPILTAGPPLADNEEMRGETSGKGTKLVNELNAGEILGFHTVSEGEDGCL